MGSLSPDKLLYIALGNIGRVWNVLRVNGADGEIIRVEVTQRLESLIAFYRFDGHKRLRIDNPKIKVHKYGCGVSVGRSDKAHFLSDESRIAEIDV